MSFVFQKWNDVICESYVPHYTHRHIPHHHPSLLLITPQELLKSASHDINSRAFLGKPLSGKLWRKEVAQE